MITLHTETLIPLRDAPKHLPPRPNGKRLHISACYRWIKRGVRGVFLESIRIGGTTYTSLEAIQRFADALTGGVPAIPARVTPPASARGNRNAARRLEIELGLRPGQLFP